MGDAGGCCGRCPGNSSLVSDGLVQPVADVLYRELRSMPVAVQH